MLGIVKNITKISIVEIIQYVCRRVSEVSLSKSEYPQVASKFTTKKTITKINIIS